MLAGIERNDPGNANRIKAVREIIKVYDQEFVHFGGDFR